MFWEVSAVEKFSCSKRRYHHLSSEIVRLSTEKNRNGDPLVLLKVSGIEKFYA